MNCELLFFFSPETLHLYIVTLLSLSRMKRIIFAATVYLLSSTSLLAQNTANINTPSPFGLIAHRGGVVGSSMEENSMQALQRAYEQGYWMVEIDVRLTKDDSLITNHDAGLKRKFGVDKPTTEMTWQDIHSLQNNLGNKVLSLEEVFAYCSGKLQVMIDNKTRGNDTVIFTRLLCLLKKYHLDKNALMIGTDESTELFTGKIKLSCTRSQLEDNKRRKDYSPSHYYLFDNDITKADVNWAKRIKYLQ